MKIRMKPSNFTITLTPLLTVCPPALWIVKRSYRATRRRGYLHSLTASGTPSPSRPWGSHRQWESRHWGWQGNWRCRKVGSIWNCKKFSCHAQTSGTICQVCTLRREMGENTLGISLRPSLNVLFEAEYTFTKMCLRIKWCMTATSLQYHPHNRQSINGSSTKNQNFIINSPLNHGDGRTNRRTDAREADL